MIITLNDKQKEFLFKEYYVDSKVLDAYTYKGWEQYFIKNFHWKLHTTLNWFNMRDLKLINKETGEIDYEISLNFQGNDLNTLLNM
jgi:hypothetical protein